MTNDTKLIKITSRGRVITSRGYVPTPIMRPYREKIDEIWSMLNSKDMKPTIMEVLSDGVEVELNVQNFDQDNSVKVPLLQTAGVDTPTVNAAQLDAVEEVPGTQEETTETPTVENDTIEETTTIETVEEVAPTETIMNETEENLVREAYSEEDDKDAVEEVPGTQEETTETPVDEEVAPNEQPKQQNNNNNNGKNKNNNRR
jgi:hypothetical protein